MKDAGLKPVAPPRSVFKYFQKEYFKHKTKFTDEMKTVWDATRMWTKLSAEERERFRLKFEASKCQHEKEYVRYLGKLEPYLLRKSRCKETRKQKEMEIHFNTREEINNMSSEEDENNCHEDSLSHPPHCAAQTSGFISSHRNLTEDLTEMQTLPHENIPHLPIKMPMPPPRDSKSLFMMTNVGSDVEKCEDTWKMMPRKQKSRYNAAVKTLKKEYLLKYRLHLMSLSNFELAEHLRARKLTTNYVKT